MLFLFEGNMLIFFKMLTSIIMVQVKKINIKMLY